MAGKSFFDMIDNVAMSMSQLTNSYILTGASITNPNQGTGPNSNNRYTANADVYYEFLKDYHFVNSVIDLYASNVTETLDKCDFKIEVKGNSDSPIAEDINSFLDVSNLKDYIKSHINEFIYRGQYSFITDFENNSLIDIEKPYSVDIVKDGGDIIGYIYGNKLIPEKYMATYYYKAGISTPIKKKDNDKLYKELELSKNNKFNKDDLKDIVVRYSKFKGESMFKKQLTRIFQMFTLEYSLFYLGLRDTLRPELLGMSTGGRSVNIAQSLNIANNVESLLNQSTQGLSNVMDPMAFMNNLTFQILNYVKVVPSVEQYSSINDLAFGDLSQKRERLKLERENAQKDLLNNLAVPEELFIGSGNRWEVMARNDRYMTASDSIIKSITRLVKQIAVSYSKYKGTPLTLQDVQFNIDYTSMLTSYDVKSKVETCADKFSHIERLLASVASINATNFTDKEGMYKYLVDQLSGIDEKLAKAFPSIMPQYAGKSDEMIMQEQQMAMQLNEQQSQLENPPEEIGDGQVQQSDQNTESTPQEMPRQQVEEASWIGER